MAAKTKKEAQASQIVLVDAKKLGQGLKTTFEGVAMVFDSIGADAEITVSEIMPKAEKAGQKTKEEKSEGSEAPEKAETAETTEKGKEKETDETEDAGSADVGENADVTDGDNDSGQPDGSTWTASI